ncbi:MAG TPA: AraC family transcriptional regulator N-terminal domain-containing protein, partial [Thermoanaerobaculia bacterium]
MKPDITRLAELIAAHAPYDGVFEMRVPGISVYRLSRTSTELTHAMQRSSVCIIAQGAKSVMLGEDVHQYEASQVAVY